MQRWPVSKRVNSSRAADDDPTLVEIEARPAAADELSAARNVIGREFGLRAPVDIDAPAGRHPDRVPVICRKEGQPFRFIGHKHLVPPLAM
jgi:hypothetical protein